MDLLLGTLLVGLSVILWIRRADRSIPAEAPRRSVRPGGAIGFGAFSMATNFTTRWLNALGRLITVHGRTVVVVVVAALGVYLLGHGVLKLAHL